MGARSLTRLDAAGALRRCQDQCSQRQHRAPTRCSSSPHPTPQRSPLEPNPVDIPVAVLEVRVTLTIWAPVGLGLRRRARAGAAGDDGSVDFDDVDVLWWTWAHDAGLNRAASRSRNARIAISATRWRAGSVLPYGRQTALSEACERLSPRGQPPGRRQGREGHRQGDWCPSGPERRGCLS
jgi:hypothetical protein